MHRAPASSSTAAGGGGFKRRLGEGGGGEQLQPLFLGGEVWVDCMQRKRSTPLFSNRPSEHVPTGGYERLDTEIGGGGGGVGSLANAWRRGIET